MVTRYKIRCTIYEGVYLHKLVGPIRPLIVTHMFSLAQEKPSVGRDDRVPFKQDTVAIHHIAIKQCVWEISHHNPLLGI